MLKIRQILADNLKINRRKRGFSQVKLAEKADVSAQYIAMIEMCSKFPKPEMLERLAKALGIEAYELFTVTTSPKVELETLRKEIVVEVVKVIKDTLLDTGKARKKK